jgi:autophagy-related protein 2
MDDDDDNLEGLSGAFEVVGSFYDPTGLQRNSVDARSRIYSPRQSVSSSRAHARATPFSRPSQLKFRHPSLNSPLNKASGHVHSSRNSGAMNAWNSAANRYGVLSGIGQKECPLRIKLSTGTFIWNLFDGYDWIKTQKTIAQAVEEVQIRAAKRRLNRQKLPAEEDDGESEIGDFLFQSIWIAVPPNRDEQDLRRQINREMDDLTSETSTVTTTAESRTTNRPVPKRNKSRALKLDRSKRRKVSFEIHELKVDVTVLPPGRTETQSSIDVRVGDLDIYDHVPSSTWRKFVTYMHDAGPRPYRKPMIHLELQTVKPKLDLAAIELVIRVTVSPLRLHVDQDTLDFITRFFEFKDDTRPASTDPAEPPFIQRCEVRAVPLKLDYKPKKVDYGGLRSGHTKEFMNFIILDGAEIQLKRIIVFGISGFDRLHKVLNDLWVTDVTRNQLPTVLQGLAPLRPLVNVGSGVRDLIVIPMREYQKDGRLVRSIQKGAVAFARTTTSEIARLGAKVAMGTGNILQGAESLLSPTSPNGPVTTEQDEEPSNASGRRAVSSYANQPLTVASGIRYAVRHLERDLMSTRDAIIAVGAEIRDSESATDVARAVFRSAPAVILKPAIGTSRAIGTALLGAGNALDKDSRRKAEDVSACIVSLVKNAQLTCLLQKYK